MVIGDRWVWKRTDLTDYPVATFGLTYSAVRHGDTGATFAITASESGTEYVVEVASATTAAYAPGQYDWTAYITRTTDSERITLGAGMWLLRANEATDSSDPRTFAAQQIERLQATLARLAAQEISSYSVAARSATRKQEGEVRRELLYWQRVRSGELSRERSLAGRATGNNYRVRLS